MDNQGILLATEGTMARPITISMGPEPGGGGEPNGSPAMHLLLKNLGQEAE